MLKPNSTLKNIKGIYVLYFELILIFRTIGPLILMPNLLDKLFFVSSGLIGLTIIFIDAIDSIKKSNQKKFDIWLILFIAIMLISSLVNIKYGLAGNLKLIMWQAIYFFVIFQYGKDYGKKDKIFDYFFVILIIFWFFSAIISLWMFFTQFGVKIPMDNRYYPLRMGFLGNRLFGVFPDPNFGATISVVVILLSVYYIKTNSNRTFTLFNSLNILLQLMFISLSGSRTALIVLLTVTAVGMFFVSYHSKKIDSQKLFLRWILSIISSLLTIAVLYLIIDALKTGLSYIPSLLQMKEASLPTIDTKNNLNKVNLDRPDVSNGGDISNLRFSLWSSAVEIFKSSWLVGASAANYIPYAHDVLPDSFIGQNTLTTHNFVFLIMASTGASGLLVFFIFFINKIYISLKYLFGNSSLIQDMNFYVILSVLAITISALFITELVLVSTIGAVVIWLFLGKITSLENKK
ncbi:O-antigen ligase family protein [Enterococcus faecalis]|uniref:O-antigen ligase family protein n=1 Tax=Enterococcus faecalis TaxID=1351 RepID=UPI0024695520|nr:O-antigen ligase family protein [Enterococcus faecalis]MDH5126265.1 O-antigen ligase family protein [Enterococcus faecalis]